MKRLALFAATLLLAACAQFGIQQPQSFNQAALAATATSQAILRTAIDLRAQGRLSDADRDNVVATVRTAEQGIDLAQAVVKTCPKDAATGEPSPACADPGFVKLRATVAVLNALSAYLATKGAAK
jgi:hypothetical protein